MERITLECAECLRRNKGPPCSHHHPHCRGARLAVKAPKAKVLPLVSLVTTKTHYAKQNPPGYTKWEHPGGEGRMWGTQDRPGATGAGFWCPDSESHSALDRSQRGVLTASLPQRAGSDSQHPASPSVLPGAEWREGGSRFCLTELHGAL